MKINSKNFFLPGIGELLLEWRELVEHALALAPRYAIQVIDFAEDNRWKEDINLWPLMAMIAGLKTSSRPLKKSKSKQDQKGYDSIAGLAPTVIEFLIEVLLKHEDVDRRIKAALALAGGTYINGLELRDERLGLQVKVSNYPTGAITYREVRKALILALKDSGEFAWGDLKEIVLLKNEGICNLRWEDGTVQIAVRPEKYMEHYDNRTPYQAMRLTVLIALQDALQYNKARRSLIQILLQDKDPEMRSKAAEILARATRYGNVRDALVLALKDKNYAVRERAVLSLEAAMEHKTVRKALLEAILRYKKGRNYEQWEFIVTAAMVLRGALLYTDVNKTLLNVFHDETLPYKVRSLANLALYPRSRQSLRFFYEHRLRGGPNFYLWSSLWEWQDAFLKRRGEKDEEREEIFKDLQEFLPGVKYIVDLAIEGATRDGNERKALLKALHDGVEYAKSHKNFLNDLMEPDEALQSIADQVIKGLIRDEERKSSLKALQDEGDVLPTAREVLEIALAALNVAAENKDVKTILLEALTSADRNMRIIAARALAKAAFTDEAVLHKIIVVAEDPAVKEGVVKSLQFVREHVKVNPIPSSPLAPSENLILEERRDLHFPPLSLKKTDLYRIRPSHWSLVPPEVVEIGWGNDEPKVSNMVSLLLALSGTATFEYFLVPMMLFVPDHIKFPFRQEMRRRIGDNNEAWTKVIKDSQFLVSAWKEYEQGRRLGLYQQG